MHPEQLRIRHFEREFLFNTSRSSGPGGQNVNKVSSKVELRFSIPNSQYLSEEEKALLMRKLVHSLTKEGEWIIVCQTSRSQLTNKQTTIDLFYQLMASALTPVKPRKATNPTRASVAQRLAKKRINSDRKSSRKYRHDE